MLPNGATKVRYAAVREPQGVAHPRATHLHPTRPAITQGVAVPETQSSPNAMFRMTRHGYEPADVHARIDELTQQLFEARKSAESERRRADESERAAEDMRTQVHELERRTGLPSYESVAQRVRSILETADEAAMELRACAESDAETRKQEAEDRVASILAEARVEADATVRRGRQEAASAIADAERRVQGMRRELAQLEQQRDRVLDAMGSLRDRLTHVAQDLVPSSSAADHEQPEDSNVVALPAHEERRDSQPRHDDRDGSHRGADQHLPEQDVETL